MPRELLAGADVKGPLLLNSSAGSSGQVLRSAGANQPPTWGDPAGLSYGSGAPAFTPSVPQLYLDVTNGRLYAWNGSAWLYAQLGALTWQAGT